MRAALACRRGQGAIDRRRQDEPSASASPPPGLLALAFPVRADDVATLRAIERNDLGTALSEARRGAQAGNARAQHLYGQMLLKDRGARADPREGIRWLRAAADSGDAIARRDLGTAYMAGTGVPKDKAESARWMRAAADQGDPRAQLALATYHQKGIGVPQDLLQAYVWISLAVRARDPRASDARREIAQAISPEQRREGDRLVKSWATERIAARKAEANPKPLGSGSIVSADGHVVTSDQVVRDCKDLRIRRLDESVGTTRVVAQSSDDDLALLKADFLPDTVAPFRWNRDLRQGDAVVAFGFALSGVLTSSANLAVGKVAPAGPGIDESFVHVSTAIQPGNSGGPLLDMNGRIVGITGTSIGTQEAGQAAGAAAPGNVNLAIRGEVAAGFLEKHGVALSATGGAPREIDPADVGDRAKHFTVRIECVA